jgi:hypothetical protein
MELARNQGDFVELPEELTTKQSEDIDAMFTYAPPEPVDVRNYQAIRDAAKHFAAIVLVNTPKSADQSAAIRKIREAVMTANAAVALRGRF